MKKIYFVRHGESEGNVGSIRQASISSLTQKGREQSAYVAERVKKLPIEVIIASTMGRAQETARIISKKIGKEFESSGLFAERRRPSDQLGKPKDDPIAIRSQELIQENFLVPGFRYSDEENFEDLKERSGEALKFLQARPEQNILVVTHGFIMRIIMARAVFGEALAAKECQQFIRAFHMENTGISVLGYNEKEENPWWLWVWNDHAHLG